MKAKEKAQQLVNSLLPFMEHSAVREDKWEKLPNAKKCAMIITEEILGALYDEGIREGEGTRIFWYDVQTELKNL